MVLRHDRRRILWPGATAHPTAEWIARQVTEAIGWDEAPLYLIRDRDRATGRRYAAHSRHEHWRSPTALRSPWQNGYAEPLIGFIQRECLDHAVVVGERHLSHVLRLYQVLQQQPHSFIR
jgi:hypothetical protein